MSVVGDAVVRVTVHVTIGGVGIAGAIVRFFNEVTEQFWQGYTKSGGYTEAIDVGRYGYKPGDRINVQAEANVDGHSYAQMKQVTVFDNMFVTFAWDYVPPTIRHWVTINVETDIPDPLHTGIHDPPIVRAGLTGVRLLFKKGYTMILDAVTDDTGSFNRSMLEDTYELTLSKDGYVTVTDTISVQAQFSKTYFMEPIDKTLISGMDLSEWEKYLSWQNILKAGAVIILVGAGSKAFKEFKETFKK